MRVQISPENETSNTPTTTLTDVSQWAIEIVSQDETSNTPTTALTDVSQWEIEIVYQDETSNTPTTTLTDDVPQLAIEIASENETSNTPITTPTDIPQWAVEIASEIETLKGKVFQAPLPLQSKIETTHHLIRATKQLCKAANTALCDMEIVVDQYQIDKQVDEVPKCHNCEEAMDMFEQRVLLSADVMVDCNCICQNEKGESCLARTREVLREALDKIVSPQPLGHRELMACVESKASGGPF